MYGIVDIRMTSKELAGQGKAGDILANAHPLNWGSICGISAYLLVKCIDVLPGEKS